MKTELNDRILWNDGTNQVHPDQVPYLLLLGVPAEKIVVSELNRDIELFNSLADNPITMSKEGNDSFDMTWQIPDEYKNIKLFYYLDRKLVQKVSTDELATYQVRLAAELEEISKRNLQPLFQSLIYIIDVLKKEKKVWGVGRGSSCASLALHLIGVHEVDPVRFNIPLAEFFHD